MSKTTKITIIGVILGAIAGVIAMVRYREL